MSMKSLRAAAFAVSMAALAAGSAAAADDNGNFGFAPTVEAAAIDAAGAPALENVSGMAADEARIAPNWLMAALATGALAALAALIRRNPVLRRAAETTATAARSAAQAAGRVSAEAVNAVAKAAASPFRAMLMFAGLAAFALLGVGFYNIEWVGGLAAGAALAIMAIRSGGAFKRALAPIRNRKR